MANITQTTSEPNTSIYKYTASMKYVLGEDVYYIDTMRIKSIAIDYNYKSMNMPMIFITAAIDKKTIDKMVQNQDSGIIILDIKRCVTNSDMPDLYTDYIVDNFIYFIAEDINKNDEADYEGENADREDIYKLTTLGLLSLDHVNKNKKVLNGVINGKLSSAMYYVTGHLPIIIEPPTNNVTLVNRFLPPMNSVSKALEYLNSLNVFYSTAYRFFIDFDFAYLLSSSGKAVKRKGEDISTVFLVLRNSYDEGSKIQGMITSEEQAMYQIEIDANDCELADNHISDKSYTKINATNTSGATSNASLSNKSTGSVVTAKTKNIRISNDNTGLLENMVSTLDNASIQLLVQKVDIDSSVLTMNKEYVVKADDVYKTEAYNGKYILTRKRELYIREDENFSMNAMLLLEKVVS